MKKIIWGSLWVMVLLFLASGPAMAQTATAGLEPGANVRIVKKDGNVFEGKLVKTITTEYQVNTTAKMAVKKYLKDIQKITDTGKSDLGGGISYRPVHEYVTTGGQTFQGIYFHGMGMTFDLDLGTYGIQKGIAIESLQSIEVIPSGTGGRSEQECTVTCPHCGKLIKIRASK